MEGVGALLDETKPKTVYKPGWAKPKIKASPHKPPKPGSKKRAFKAKPGPAILSREAPAATRKPDVVRGPPARPGPPKSRKGR